MQFKASLKQKTPSQLIQLFKSEHAVKHADNPWYRYSFEMNQMIHEELKSRGSSAAKALREHVDDAEDIGESGSDRRTTVGQICRELLRAIAATQAGK